MNQMSSPKNNPSDQDQVEIRKSRFEDIARSGFLDLKKSGDQVSLISRDQGDQEIKPPCPCQEPAH